MFHFFADCCSFLVIEGVVVVVDFVFVHSAAGFFVIPDNALFKKC